MEDIMLWEISLTEREALTLLWDLEQAADPGAERTVVGRGRGSGGGNS